MCVVCVRVRVCGCGVCSVCVCVCVCGVRVWCVCFDKVSNHKATISGKHCSLAKQNTVNTVTPHGSGSSSHPTITVWDMLAVALG